MEGEDEPGGSMDLSVGADGDLAHRIGVERFLDAVTDYAISLLDPDGRVLTWNEGAERLAGYRAEEIVGDHVSRLFPGDAIGRDAPERTVRRAAESGRAEYEGWLVRGDGSRLWAHVLVTPILDDDGTLLGFAQVARDLTEKRERTRELRQERAFTGSILDAQPDILYAFDRRGRLLRWNDRVCERTGYSDDELERVHPLEFVPDEDRGMIAEAIRRILEEGTAEVRESAIVTRAGERIPHEFSGAPILEDGEIIGFTGIGRDISDRKARERELRRQRTELRRLNRLNAVVRGIDQALVDAETREEIEAAIVDRLATADPYVFALVGEFDPALGRFRTRATAGIDGNPFEGALPPVDGLSAAERPEAVALDTRTVQVLQDLPEEGEYDRWRTDARERGYHSVAVVPLVGNDRQHGLLCLYSTRRFTERERGLLEEFGHSVGHAIATLEARRLLYADTVLELEFRSTDPENVFTDLSRAAGCRIVLEHVVPVTDTDLLYYVSIAGAVPDEIRALAADEPAVTAARPVGDHGDETVWEFEVHDSTLTELLSEYGARTRSAVADRGELRLLVEVAVDADVRRLVEAARAKFPRTEFVAKREVERPSETRSGFRRRTLAELTDKQRTALEAAYYADYFEWPSRGRTAEGLAETLGISRSTLQQHLRVAERKLLAAFLEDPP